jgi:hypothetical protein
MQIKDSIDLTKLSEMENRIISDEPISKNCLVPMTIASKTEEINLYNPENHHRPHLFTDPQPKDNPSLRDSQRNFQLKIGGSQESIGNMNFSKESGNEPLFGINSPSINSKHFMAGNSSSNNENEEVNIESNKNSDKKEINEKPQSDKNQNKNTLEKKLHLKMHKMDLLDDQLSPKENKNDANKNSILTMTGQKKPKMKSIKDKFKEKMLKNKLKLKQGENNNLNKKFYNLPQSFGNNQFNQVPSGMQVNPNLYGARYSSQRTSVGFGQFPGHFGYQGIYMNPVNQFPRKEGIMIYVLSLFCIFFWNFFIYFC